MSAIPPLIRIGSNYHETRSLGDPAKIRSVALNKFGKPPVQCYWPGSGGGPRGMGFAIRIRNSGRFSLFSGIFKPGLVTVISVTRLELLPAPSIPDQVDSGAVISMDHSTAVLVILHFQAISGCG